MPTYTSNEAESGLLKELLRRMTEEEVKEALKEVAESALARL